MLNTADRSNGHGGLLHRALPYGCKEEFLAGVIPFIREGLDRRNPIHVVTTSCHADWLRATLGAAAQRVVFSESSAWYRHPARALAGLHRIVRLLGTDGPRVRIIGEPLWTTRTARELTEWFRYESLVNIAFASTNATFVCTYDTRMVDSAEVDRVARTHPELIGPCSTRSSPSYTDPVVFNDECDKSPLPEPPSSAATLEFYHTGKHAEWPAFVVAHAVWAGASEQHVNQLMLAVEEIADNAIVHGGGRGLLRIWTSRRTLVCEVSDAGAGLIDRLAGQLLPGPGPGWGLWLARQVCDLVEMRSSAEGTTVRLHLALY